MALGMPIAFALLLCGVALMVHLDMMDAQIIAQNLITGADSFPLMAVPFFILAGEIMNRGGLSKRIVNIALALVGHVRGGLGYVVVLASLSLMAAVRVFWQTTRTAVKPTRMAKEPSCAWASRMYCSTLSPGTISCTPPSEAFSLAKTQTRLPCFRAPAASRVQAPESTKGSNH